MRKYLVGIMIGATLVAAPFFAFTEATAAPARATGICQLEVIKNGQRVVITKPDDFCDSERGYPQGPTPVGCALPGVLCPASSGKGR